jgi:pantoate--beta-alanine ligase
VARGERSAAAVVAAARSVLDEEPLLRVDYVELVDPWEMLPVDTITGEALLVLAIHAGATRLLDNAVLAAGT